MGFRVDIVEVEADLIEPIAFRLKALSDSVQEFLGFATSDALQA